MLKFSADLSLPVDVATQTLAFIARKGAGKTYAAGKLVELLLEASVQVIILDTVGNWYGLRLGSDGKGKGFDIPVIGGLRGDIPLQATAGSLVADIAVETGRSLVVDLSQFSLADRRRFATAFGEQLWLRKKGEARPVPVHLVLEESQLIVPQKVDGATARMVGIYEEIIRLGRNYGIGVSMISQRPQSVNKDVLNQTECLLVGQVNGAQERKALGEWIVYQGIDKGLVDELPGLPIGTFYVWSPQWLRVLKRVRVGHKHTFDASATPTGRGTARKALKKLDLTVLEQAMAESIEQAKANDPGYLRRQLADRDRRIRDLERRTPEAKTKTIERKVITPAQTAKLETLTGRLEKAVSELRAALTGIGTPESPSRPSPPVRVLQAERAAPAAHPRNGQPKDGAPLGKGEARILRAVGQHPEGVTRQQLTVLTGYKRSSRDTYLQRLLSRECVERRGDRLIITAEGISHLGDQWEPLPTGAALRQHWLETLTGGERAIFALLVDGYPQSVHRDVITDETGYKRSSRDTYIQRLKARQLVVPEGDGVKASDTLFA